MGSSSIDFKNQTAITILFKNRYQLDRRSKVFLSHNFRDNFFIKTKFLRDIFCKFEGDFNFLGKFYFDPIHFPRDILYNIEVEFPILYFFVCIHFKSL